MSSRKESLKKYLGISEYPWSSDDEDIPTPAPQEPSGLRRLPEPRTSMVDMPGTSGVAPTPSTSLGPTPSSLTSQRKDNKSETDRDLFWSIINTYQSIPLISTRVSEPSSSAKTPREQRAQRPSPDIQHILAIKRLTRNLSTYRPSRFNMVPNRNTPGPSPAGPINIRSNRAYGLQSGGSIPGYGARASTREMSARRGAEGSVREAAGTDQVCELVNRMRDVTAEVPPRRTSLFSIRDLVGTEDADRPPVGAPNGDDAQTQLSNEVRPPRGAPPTSAPQAARPPREHVPFIDNSDDETDNAILSQTVPSPRNDLSNPELETNTENDTSGVSLEQIVEMEAADGASDVDMAAEPAAPAQPEANDAASSNHGIKRKRELSDDDNAELYTVKEFNQNLLRLLECPVCLEWMSPPMSQCRRGHLVCNRCRVRLASCPVCRTTFSSVRNRAMEGVAEMLRYPCRYGCGREVRLRRRAPHEASCSARKYHCPAPQCAERAPLPRDQLPAHFQSKHLSMMKIGRKHRFSIKVNSEQHDNWVVFAFGQYFHLRVDVDIRAWGAVVYVAYIGPKCDAQDYTYEVSVDGQHSARRLVYTRAAHSDLECSSLNVSRQDCFHLTLDQALNFLRVKNRHCEPDKFLDFEVDISKPDLVKAEDDS